MAGFAIDLWDISLLLAVTAIILLITSEMLSPYYGRVHVLISKKRLKNVAIVISTLFLGTVTIRVVGIVLGL